MWVDLQLGYCDCPGSDVLPFLYRSLQQGKACRGICIGHPKIIHSRRHPMYSDIHMQSSTGIIYTIYTYIRIIYRCISIINKDSYASYGQGFMNRIRHQPWDVLMLGMEWSTGADEAMHRHASPWRMVGSDFKVMEGLYFLDL